MAPEGRQCSTQGENSPTGLHLALPLASLRKILEAGPNPQPLLVPRTGLLSHWGVGRTMKQ